MIKSNKLSLEVCERAVRMVQAHRGEYSQRIVGWRVSRSKQGDFVLDGLEQALCGRQLPQHLTHNSSRGWLYVSIRYTESPDQAGIQPPVGSRGGSCNNALGMVFKTPVAMATETRYST